MAKVVEGVFAIHKPTGISSAQVLRDLQKQFNPSELFAPWIADQKRKLERESANQKKRRKQKQIQVKIGHGGTLDPLATGVLIAGIGSGTKSLQEFLLCTKTYETVVIFGASTDTYDRTGKILKRAPYNHITREMVEKALDQFRGKIMQLPPLYSALKMNGKPLYEYAREGKEIPREIEKRAVEVVELELLDWYEGGTHEHQLPIEEAGGPEKQVAEALWKQERLQEGKEESPEDILARRKRKHENDQDGLVTDRPVSKRKLSTQDASMSGGLGVSDDDTILETPHQSTGASPIPEQESSKPYASKSSSEDQPPAAKLRMTVTSGFYVRSLCHDLGEAVGSAANMAELVRSRQGVFELGKNVLAYEDIEKGEKVWGPKVEKMLNDWPIDAKKSAQTIPETPDESAKEPELVKQEVAEAVAVEDEKVENNAIASIEQPEAAVDEEVSKEAEAAEEPCATEKLEREETREERLERLSKEHW